MYLFLLFLFKVVQACAFTLGIDVSLITVKSTNVITAPNDGVTSASSGTDGVSYVSSFIHLRCMRIRKF